MICKNSLSRYVHCADEFNHGVYPVSRDKAVKKRNIRLNTDWKANYLLFDIDHGRDSAEIWQENNVPAPDLITQNKINGNCHYVYILNTPVLLNGYLHPIEYLSYAHKVLVYHLRADPSYSGFLTKNPFSDFWRVIEFNFPGGRSIGDLIGNLDQPDFLHKRFFDEGLGRNCSLFYETRKFAYKKIFEWRKQEFFEWKKFLVDFSENKNFLFENPLYRTEMLTIVNSVAMWTWKRREESVPFEEIQRRRCEKSHVVRRENAKVTKEAAMRMRYEGMSITKIAESLSIGAETVNRWIREF